jgi:hypothetical protein
MNCGHRCSTAHNLSQLAPFEAWVANTEPTAEFKDRAQSGRSLGFAVIGREEDPLKLYEVAVIHYGKLEEFDEAGFVKLIAKSAAGSPGDSGQTVLSVHTSLYSHNTPYSRSVLSDPSATSKFDPSRVWLAPSGILNKLDRVYRSAIDPLPSSWVSHSQRRANKALASPQSTRREKQDSKSGKRMQKKNKRQRSSSGSHSSSEFDSPDEEKAKISSRAEQAARFRRVRSVF